MRIATLCGSLHSGSTNAVVLRRVVERIEAHGGSVEAVGLAHELPAFRPEQVDDPPAAVQAVRRSFAQADGAVFSVPEYAGGAPGWVKNALDWLVGAAGLYQRPVVVASSATSGGANAVAHLTQTLTWHGAYVVATLGIAAPLTIVRDGRFTDADVVARIDAATDVLLGVLRGEIDVADTTAAVLAPFGLSMADRLA